MRTAQRRRTLARWIVAVAALSLLAVGCGDDDATDSAGGATTTTAAESPGDSEAIGFPGTFVGKVEGTDAAIAVLVTPDGSAAAYVCDGTPEKVATVAALLDGAHDEGTLDLATVGGVEVAGEIGDEVTGTVTINGTDHAFTAVATDEQAGFYDAAATLDGDEIVARWILAADGTVRGALRRGGVLQPAPWTDPNPEPVVEVQGIGGLQRNLLDPWTDPEPIPWTDPDPQPLR